VGESIVEHAALGIFLAASERLVTERTHLKMVGCQMGILPSGLTLLAPLAAGSSGDDGILLGESQRAAMVMALALGGASINAHDAAKLKLSSMFCHARELPGLLSELRAAPSDYLDVPLSRHSEPVPPSHAHLFAENVVVDAVERCFGPTCSDAADMLVRLDAERKRVATLTRSCSFHVRERAETVAEILEDARVALDPRRSSPSALAATFVVLRLCWRTLAAERSRPLGTAVDTTLLDAQALLANERLLGRVDFGEALRAHEMNGRPARSGRPAAARIVPRWQPSTLGCAALEIASEIEAEWSVE
jgi:enoyl-CoA hydratase/carnithine racemase